MPGDAYSVPHEGPQGILAPLYRYIPKVYVKVLLGLLLSLPLLFVELDATYPTANRVAFVTVLMAVYWITQCVPIAVTSLMPLFLFPVLGVLSGKKVASYFMNDAVILFLGSFILAIAMEDHNLHRRLALRLLLAIGGHPRRLLAGFMVATAFLSMWISNSATTAMMVPIAIAVLKECAHPAREPLSTESELTSPQQEGSDYSESLMPPNIDGEPTDDAGDPLPGASDALRLYSKGMVMAIAAGASIGGMATLTGTGPNLVLLQQYKQQFPNADPSLSFGQWFVYGFPLATVFLIVAWLWFSWRFCKPDALKNFASTGTHRVRQMYKDLGPMRRSEVIISVFFVILGLAWFFRDPKIFTGWSAAFGNPEYLTDGTCAIFMATLLYFIPSGDHDAAGNPVMLLSKASIKRLPWDIVLLFGGGFALAKGFECSGLSEVLGEWLEVFSSLPPFVLVLFITVVISLMTNFSSNVVTAQVVLPILATLAITINQHPMLLMVPGTIACSLAFTLPVSTPPNAIAFSTGFLEIKDMVKSGLFLNAVGIVFCVASVFALAIPIFSITLGKVPDWAVAASSGDVRLCT